MAWCLPKVLVTPCKPAKPQGSRTGASWLCKVLLLQEVKNLTNAVGALQKAWLCGALPQASSENRVNLLWDWTID